MKDGIALLATGLACSVVAWAILSALGPYVQPILISFAMVSLFVDNIRLRRKLRELRKTRPPAG